MVRGLVTRISLRNLRREVLDPTDLIVGYEQPAQGLEVDPFEGGALHGTEVKVESIDVHVGRHDAQAMKPES